MALPFTEEEFMNVFKNYNESIWPTQILLNIVAIVAIYLLISDNENGDKLVPGILGILWIWTGLMYHIINFSKVYTIAYVFGGLYIVQGIIFIYYGVVKESLNFNPTLNIYTIIGAILVFYALVVYPILGYYLGHIYPKSPTFGAPCPLTIFTFGIILLTTGKIDLPILIIPLLWSFIGISAAINYKVWEDIMLVISGVVSTVMIYYRNLNFQ